MKAAQVSTASFPSRHEYLFEDARSAVPNAERLLSVGCAGGFEALDLKRFFPKADVSGCDVSPKALAEARTLCEPLGITVFESNVENIRRYAPYDLITCMSVLVRYPAVQDQQDISEIYPFSEFDDSVSLLVDSLKPGGVLALFNSCYLMEQASAVGSLEPLPVLLHRSNGWIDKYDRTGRRLTCCRGIVSGEEMSLKQWRSALRANRSLTDESCIRDMAEHRLNYRHDLLTSQDVNLATTLWRKHTGIEECSGTVKLDETATT